MEMSTSHLHYTLNYSFVNSLMEILFWIGVGLIVVAIIQLIVLLIKIKKYY